MLKYRQEFVPKIFELVVKCEEEQESKLQEVIGITYNDLSRGLKNSGYQLHPRVFSDHLKQMCDSNWLSRIDCGRGKNVFYKITWIGEIAYHNQIALESNDHLKKALQIILVLSFFGMYYKQQISQGEELKSVLQYNPNTIYGYFDISSREGFRIKDLSERFGHNPGVLLQHGPNSEHILRELIKQLVDDEILKEIRVNNDGKTELRYVLLKPDLESDPQPDFIKFIADCVSKLHNEVLNRMFFSWTYLTKPTQKENEWFKQTHGLEKWHEMEVMCNYNRKHIKDISKELRKRKIDPKKTAPRTVDIVREPFQKDGVYLSYMDEDLAKERLQELDCQILSNLEELEPTLTNLLKDRKYIYYTRIILDLCFPEFLQKSYLKRKLIDT